MVTWERDPLKIRLLPTVVATPHLQQYQDAMQRRRFNNLMQKGMKEQTPAYGVYWVAQLPFSSRVEMLR